MTEVVSAMPLLAREDGSDALKGVQEHVFVSRDTLADRDAESEAAEKRLAMLPSVDDLLNRPSVEEGKAGVKNGLEDGGPQVVHPIESEVHLTQETIPKKDADIPADEQVASPNHEVAHVAAGANSEQITNEDESVKAEEPIHDKEPARDEQTPQDEHQSFPAQHSFLAPEGLEKDAEAGTFDPEPTLLAAESDTEVPDEVPDLNAGLDGHAVETEDQRQVEEPAAGDHHAVVDDVDQQEGSAPVDSAEVRASPHVVKNSTGDPEVAELETNGHHEAAEASDKLLEEDEPAKAEEPSSAEEPTIIEECRAAGSDVLATNRIPEAASSFSTDTDDEPNEVLNAVEPESVEATNIITASQDVAIKAPASDNKPKGEQEVAQADEPTATKIPVAEEESEDPILEPTSETAPVVSVEAEDAPQEHGVKVDSEIVSDAETKETIADTAAQKEQADSVETLTQAYEVEHAHENDEVVADMPSDEEVKAAIPEVQFGNDDEGIEAEAEAEATSAEPNNNPSAHTQASSESGMESLGSIPTETGGTPSVAPEEQSTPLIPEEFEGNVKVNESEVSTGLVETETPEGEPEAHLPTSDDMPTISIDGAETSENIALETGPGEDLAEAVPIEAEPEVQTQEVGSSFSKSAGPEEQNEELARAVTDSSEIVAQPEGGEVAQTLEVGAPGDINADELMPADPIVAIAGLNTEAVADFADIVTSNEVDKPAEEPTSETKDEDAVVSNKNEVDALADVEQDDTAPEASTVENTQADALIEGEIPVNQDSVLPSDEPTATEETVAVEVSDDTPEAVADQIVVAEGAAGAEEPGLEKLRIDEERILEPVQAVVEPLAVNVLSTDVEEQGTGLAIEAADPEVVQVEDTKIDESVPDVESETQKTLVGAREKDAVSLTENVGTDAEHEASNEVEQQLDESGLAEELVPQTKDHNAAHEEPLDSDEPVAHNQVSAAAEGSVPEPTVEGETQAAGEIETDAQAAEEAAKNAGDEDHSTPEHIVDAAPQDDHDLVKDIVMTKQDPMEDVDNSGVPSEERAAAKEADIGFAAQSGAEAEPVDSTEKQQEPAEEEDTGVVSASVTEAATVEPVEERQQTLEAIESSAETQEIAETVEEPVPEVEVELPTPSTETLSFSIEEDEAESDIPLEQRLAEAISIPAHVIAQTPVLSAPVSAGDEDPSSEELITPTESKGTYVRTESHDTEELRFVESQDEGAPAIKLAVDSKPVEAPERPKSPYIPSYSVTTQGSSLDQSEEPEIESSAKELVDANPVITGLSFIEESSTSVTAPVSDVGGQSAKDLPSTDDNEDYTEAVDENSSAPLLSEQHDESHIPGLSIDTTEVPERPKSPWTPSYSVTTQGSSPVHPEEPKVDTATDDIADTSPAATEPEVSVPLADVEKQATEDLPVAGDVEHVDANVATEALITDTSTERTGLTVEATEVKDELEQESPERILWDAPIDEASTAVEPKETLLSTLSLNTSVPRTPERPKSPWTPSYSVTRQGPGVPELEEFELDPEVADNAGDVLESHEPHQQDTGEEILPSAPRDVTVASDIPKSTLDIERPKSPYTAAYSVHQMGPGLAEDSLPASPTSGDAAESVVSSNEPEVPSSPRSELGMVTPGFDSRSEVSEASRRSNAPNSPRTDPEATSLKEAEVKTPLVLSSAEQGAPISPFQTPLVLPGNVVEETVDDVGKQETAELLTESTISGINADVETDRRSATTGSWVKETDMERESYEESLVSQPEASPISDGTSEAVFIDAVVPRETATSDEPVSATDLAIPKLDVTVAHLLAPPVVVTNTMSTDSAYTQLSDTLSPSQETGTNVTTPDVETVGLPNVNTQADSEIDTVGPLDEDTISHVSDKHGSSDSQSRTPTGPESGVKALGITQTLAMRAFPSTFSASTERSSPVEQVRQGSGSLGTGDLLDVEQLTPTSARRRLESTGSSLVFPGGWVSSPAQKERASLEVAAGEFSRPVLEGTLKSPIVTPGVAETISEEKESRWRCIIM